MKKRFSFLCVCLIVYAFTQIASAYAEQYVYPGYVVKFPNNSVNVINTKKLLNANNYKIQKSSNSYSLVIPNKSSGGFYLRSGATVKKYDEKDDTCLKLKELGALECSPNFEIKVLSTKPDDQYFREQWALLRSGINSEGDFSRLDTKKKVIVAVVDTGIDYNHPDLVDNLWVNPNEIPNNGIDDDGNGVVDDIHGASFLNSSDVTGNPYDDNGHGTHVAGIIGAKGNNSIGVTGTNWNVSIIAVKFLNMYGSGSLYDAIQAYDYLYNLKQRGVDVRVVNNSWGGTSYLQSLYVAMNNLAKKDVILTVAAGNDTEDNDLYAHYPANYDIDNLVSVASTDEDARLSYFSNTGINSVDIAAPGSNILSTFPNGTYASLSGTSMATPYVTGALSVLFSEHPDMSSSEALKRLYDTGREEASLSEDIRTGRIVDIHRLLNNISSPIPAPLEKYSYDMKRIDFNDEKLLSSGKIVLQTDERPLYNLTLPFNFEFFGQVYTDVHISPNGVVYFGYEPSSYDYMNSSTAPTNSIAALHTDLIALTNPYGVRVEKSSDKVAIYWQAKHYLRQYTGKTGDVYIKLVLYPSGVIEDYISFSDDDTADVVALSSTIGIKGTRGAVTTYAYNDPNAIVNNLALRYTPKQDDDNKLKIDSMKLYRISANKKYKKLKRSQHYKIDFLGTGTGTIKARIGFEFGYCPQVLNVNLVDGIATKKGILKLPINFAKKLKVTAPQHNKKAVSLIIQENVRNKTYDAKRSKSSLKIRCKKLFSLISK